MADTAVLIGVAVVGSALLLPTAKLLADLCRILRRVLLRIGTQWRSRSGQQISAPNPAHGHAAPVREATAARGTGYWDLPSHAAALLKYDKYHTIINMLGKRRLMCAAQ